jgi:CHAT domain-containing protein
VRSIPDRRELEASVPIFTGLLERRDGSEVGAAAALYQQLFGGLGGSLAARTRRLIVVPDGILYRLPFEALRADPKSEPLGAAYEIAIAPSATVWARWVSARPPQTAGAALVVAAPELPAAGSQAPASERAGAFGQGLALGPLEHARREGTYVRRACGGASMLLTGRRATETALKATDLARFGVLHFATHAVADDAYPDRSGVVLAPGASDDGLLQPREVAALDLGGRAVVLSACQTGAGPVVSGEGVLSLARAFAEAGARSIVAGRWRLRDDEAERLMRWLYGGLHAGDTLAASLRRARQRAVAEGMPAAAWSGLLLLGDPDFRLERGSAQPSVGLAVGLALGVVVVSIGLWIWRHRCRPRRHASFDP